MLLQHLEDFEQEGVVVKGLAHTLLIEAELRRGDGLALGNLRGVELELFVVTPLRRQLPVVLNCGTETHGVITLSKEKETEKCFKFLL